MSTLGKITRRTFLVGAAVVSGGAAFGYYKYRQPFDNPLLDDLADDEAAFNPYIKIASDNRITIIAPRAEMGQGIQTTLAALAAEELDVRLDQVSIEHGPGGAAYYNSASLVEGAPVPAFEEGMAADALKIAMAVASKFLALQFTGGSQSTVDHYEKMRLAGASAREMLKAAAAAKWGVPAAGLKTEAATVKDPASGKSLTYGELALAAVRLAPPEDIRLRDRSEWKILGQSQPRKDMPAKVTGAPIFGVDVKIEDMLHATVRMNPKLGGKLLKLDASEAQTMRGVQKIVEIRSPLGEGYGVIADNTWRAFQAADAVKVEWGEAAYPNDSKGIEAALDSALDGDPGFVLRTVGDPDAVFSAAPKERVIEADYFAPFVSHAAMEPMNATARIKDGWLDVWAPNQAPSVVKLIGARITGYEESRIRVHTTFMGGGFGRRVEPDFIDFAVRLAQAVEGRAVKTIWTREEDMSHSPLRPIAKARYRAVLGQKRPTAVIGSVAAPSPITSIVGRLFPSLPMAGPDNTMIDGAYNQPYAIENERIDGRKAALSVPVTFWRSVGYSYNVFMHESFLDEAAHALGRDPYEMRRELLEAHPAAVAVLDRAADMAGWKAPAPKGRARGIAFALSFGSWVAQVVEIAEEEGAIRIEKVWCAADAGTVLDERNYKAQIMSGIVYGLSAAIGQQITFADGVIEQMNFSDHDGLRMHQCPEIAIDLLANASHMGGAGEPGVPPVIPALANAIFALKGERLRRLPLNEGATFV